MSRGELTKTIGDARAGGETKLLSSGRPSLIEIDLASSRHPSLMCILKSEPDIWYCKQFFTGVPRATWAGWVSSGLTGPEAHPGPNATPPEMLFKQSSSKVDEPPHL